MNEKFKVYHMSEGKVLFAPVDRDNKRVGPLKRLGNIKELVISINEESIEKVESYTGTNQVVGKIPTKTTATLNCTINQFDPENLALCVNGIAEKKRAALKSKKRV